MARTWRRKMRWRDGAAGGELAAIVRRLLAARSTGYLIVPQQTLRSLLYSILFRWHLTSKPKYFHMSALPLPSTLTELSLPRVTINGVLAIRSCASCYAKKPIDKTPAGREIDSSQRSVSVRSRAEVITTLTPSMSDACETHAQSVEKSITSLALRFC
jgi:hypothetical protein